MFDIKDSASSRSTSLKLLGSVQASVVGLSHRFHTAADSNGVQLKTLATFLRQCRRNAYGMTEVVLKRNFNIVADANAVSVLVCNLDEFSEGGFLPRIVAKWVAPLCDAGFFSFSACIYPKEALSAALGESSTKVLCQYKWPESLETDFVYGENFFLGGRQCKPHFERKTWQRMKYSGIFHDAIPHPSNRVGYPMHVKVARRRFQSSTSPASFGWVYCGSHNLSPAAWGQPLAPSSNSNEGGPMATSMGSRLYICNYELGIIFIVPPSDATSQSAGAIRQDLDDMALPFVVPPPKYGFDGRPATAQAMREALAEAIQLEKQKSSAMIEAEDLADELVFPDEEEGMVDPSGYSVNEREDEMAYAETLWSQVDSSES
ncbi:hypothetical protein ACLOJK_038084 [Asimina triloba]